MRHETRSFDVAAASLDVSRRDVEWAFGYTDMSAPDYLPEMIDSALAHARTLLAVRCGYTIVPPEDTEVAPSRLRCRAVDLDTGTIIAKRLRHAESVAVFAATIGSGVETESKRLMNEGDMMGGFVYDTVGSVYAEAAADLIERTIGSAAAAAGERITNRYSPGYCDWSVAGQHSLFSLLPSGFCGITLTPSALMLPVKSVSGIIGIGPSAKREQYQCSICDMNDCIRKKYVGMHAGA